MSQYLSPETQKEFMMRTKKIISQYTELESCLGREFYDVTLLLNCLLGLIVLPREWRIDRNSIDKDIPSNIKNTLVSAKHKNGNNIEDEIRLNEYIIGLRNGIVHWGKNDSLSFSYYKGKISTIVIEGETNNWTHKLKYKFDLKSGNELSSVIDEVFRFIEESEEIFTYRSIV